MRRWVILCPAQIWSSQLSCGYSTDNLREPDLIAAEIVENLQAALEQSRLIAEDLGVISDELETMWNASASPNRLRQVFARILKQRPLMSGLAIKPIGNYLSQDTAHANFIRCR